jgi:hypothetical protein
VFVITDEGRAALERARCAVMKSESRPHLVLTDGHAADSPGNPAASVRPATRWPGAEAHLDDTHGVTVAQVGQGPIPQARFDVHVTLDAAHPEGAATGQTNLTSAYINPRAGALNPFALPIRSSDHTAPSGIEPPAPRASGPIFNTMPGSTP